jgi:hypothetical protein
MRRGINHIDKQDFLTMYPVARTESQTANNISSAFRATGIVPYNPDQVLSRLNISIQPPSTPTTASSPFIAGTPYDIRQLKQQTGVLQEMLPDDSPLKRALCSLEKGCEIAMHNAAILAKENEGLRAANERKKRKKAKKRSYIATDSVLTVQEAVDLVENRDAVVNAGTEGDASVVKTRAPRKCSKCNLTGHNARTCQKE